jgi:hypothetical protein
MPSRSSSCAARATRSGVEVLACSLWAIAGVAPALTAQATPGGGAVLDSTTRAACSNGRRDDVAIAGFVKNAATGKGVDSASVFVKWVDVTLTRRGFTRAGRAIVAKTNHDGWYVRCDIPAKATIVTWASRGGATTGAVLHTLDGAPDRLDFTIDTTARPSIGSVEVDPDSTIGSLFPMSSGAARLHVLVRDSSGHSVSNARVRILGRNVVRSDAGGAVTLDSLARGTQTIEVSAIGFQPERKVVEVASGRDPTETVVLASLKSVLGTITVTGRDPSGFELRRSTRAGQFITADEVVRLNPALTTQLLRTRDGLRYAIDRNGIPQIEVTTTSGSCRPLIVVDGFVATHAPSAPGRATLDWIIHPDEIGGVEIYNNFGQVPPEIAKIVIYPPPCAAIVFWTRERLGLPKVNPEKP